MSFLQQADDGGQRARQTAAHDGQFQVAITSGHHDEDLHSESDEGSTSKENKNLFLLLF